MRKIIFYMDDNVISLFFSKISILLFYPLGRSRELIKLIYYTTMTRYRILPTNGQIYKYRQFDRVTFNQNI